MQVNLEVLGRLNVVSGLERGIRCWSLGRSCTIDVHVTVEGDIGGGREIHVCVVWMGNVRAKWR